MEDGDGSTEEVRACLFSLLQRKCPELRITCNALGMLEGLLNEVGLIQVHCCVDARPFMPPLPSYGLCA